MNDEQSSHFLNQEGGQYAQKRTRQAAHLRRSCCCSDVDRKRCRCSSAGSTIGYPSSNAPRATDPTGSRTVTRGRPDDQGGYCRIRRTMEDDGGEDCRRSGITKRHAWIQDVL